MTFPGTDCATKPRSAHRSGLRRPWGRRRAHGRASRLHRRRVERFPRTLIDWASVAWRPPTTIRSTKRAVASPPKETRPLRPARMRRACPRRPRRAVARAASDRAATPELPPHYRPRVFDRARRRPEDAQLGSEMIAHGGITRVEGARVLDDPKLSVGPRVGQGALGGEPTSGSPSQTRIRARRGHRPATLRK